MQMLFVVLVTLLLCEQWLEAAMPISCTETSKEKHVLTKHLDRVSEQQLVWIYRSLQAITGQVNSWIDNEKTASVLLSTDICIRSFCHYKKL